MSLTHDKLSRIHTERRIPIPVKITVAGENTCQINIRVQISDKRMSLGIPGQRQLQLYQKTPGGRLWLGQAILSIVHRHSGTDPALGSDLEGQQERRWESRRFGAGRKVDVELDHFWCVSGTPSRRY
jgi:hypothetical protein